MRAVLSALMKEGVVSIVVLALLCLLVWFGGMYLDLEPGHRILIIVVLLSIWAVVFVVQRVLAIRQSVRIENQLKAQSGGELEGVDADKKAEIEALRGKFDESLQALKRTKGGKSALFTLPWYVIIGPPGSGKTTALQESGLNFPAAQGGAKVRGIGGTRNCDWWFTSDGILLDTAGRYTTVAEDQEEWFAFLEMIKQSRSGRPINGAIVAIAVDDLFRSTEAELFQMAKDVRNRLDELAARLQAVFPVYLMFTKCDLVSGFVEYFEDLNKEERGQVWGFSLPYELPERQYTDIFDEQVGKLESRIKARQLDLLTAERPPQKKQSIYLFPHQFRHAARKMRDIMEALFGANAYQESAMLRGVYFTSGTQKGTPIDQVLSRMGEAMGIGAQADGGDDRIEKKSYFIHDLFARIIFRDKTLARSNRSVLRKRRALRLGLNLFSLLALTVMAWVLISSFVGNNEIVNRVEAAGQAVNSAGDEAEEIEKLKALDKLRNELTNLYNMETEGRPVRLSFGMYHGDTMFQAGAKAYFRELSPDWVEPAHERLEARLRSLESRVGPNSDQAEYQTLLDLWRAYRMMGGDLDAEPARVQTVLNREGLWTSAAESESGELEILAGEQLKFYALMLQHATKNADPYGLLQETDMALVESVRDRLDHDFWEPVAYDSIIQRTHASMSPLTLENVVPGGEAYLELSPEDAESPYIDKINAFTESAWNQYVKSLIDESAESLERLYEELNAGERSADEWRERLIQQHRKQHERVWNQYLNAIRPDPVAFGTVNATRNALEEQVRDTSVYRKLIENVWERRRITLAPDVQVLGPTEKDAESLDEAFKVLGEFQVAFETYAQNSDANNRVLSYLEKPDPLDALKTAFTDANTKIAGPFSKANETAGVALKRIIEASLKALQKEAVTEVDGLWRRTVYDVWQAEFANRFPFVAGDGAGDSANVKMSEFSKLFNPKNGAIWRAHALFDQVSSLRFAGEPLFVTSSAYKDTINAAEKIRTAMFDSAEDEMASFRFRLKLEQTGSMASSSVRVGSEQRLRWGDNVERAFDFHWKQDPASTRGARVDANYKRLATDEREYPLPSKDELENEWGVLTIFWNEAHLFDKVEGQNQYEVQWLFQSEDKQVWMLYATVTPHGDVNPFDRELFTDMSMTEKVTK